MIDTLSENSPSSKSASESLMIAEHRRISSFYIHNASMAERRVNIHLVLLGAGIGLLGLPRLLGRVSSNSATGSTLFLPSQKDLLIIALIIIFFLLAEGVLAFRMVVDRRIKAIEYLRAINRINRYFADRDSELSMYLFWSPQDNVPEFEGKKAHGVADLRHLVAILTSMYFGALLADILMLFLAGGNLHSRLGWSAAIFSFIVGVAAAFVAIFVHLSYEKRMIARAASKAAPKERFKEYPLHSVNSTTQQATLNAAL